MSSLQILSAYGLPVNKVEISQFEDVKVLLVERFDRVWNEDHTGLYRLPQEDICQSLGIPPALKYEADGGPGIKKTMDLLQGSMTAKADREKFMKAVFLYWILGGIDGHGKNFSVAIERGGRYHLTPFYDVLSAYPMAVKRQLEWQDLKMAMAVKGKNRHYHWANIQTRHWLETANIFLWQSI